MKLAVTQFITLDGVVQAPGGPEEDTDGDFRHGGWSQRYFDEEVMGPVFDAGSIAAEAFLFGRRTWQTMAAAWPSRAGDPFADRINTIDKYVASRTLAQEDLTWENSHLLPAKDVFGAIRDLKSRGEGDLAVMGSAQLTRGLISNGLVDQLTLMLHPLVLGGGKSIFPGDGHARRFEFISSTPTSTGVQILVYRPTVE